MKNNNTDLFDNQSLTMKDKKDQLCTCNETNNKVIEIIENFWKRIQFDILSPWWNDTCLIKWIITDPEQKKKINDSIMKLYPNVEQVGFIDTESDIPRLEMAWWEFCWNATRTFISKFFNWQKGEWQFKISWVNRLLEWWIDENWEVWAEMPIYKDVDNIKIDEKWNFLVNMEWITHYICYVNEEQLNKSDEKYKEKLKEKSMSLIKELWIDNYPASWIMYVYKKWDELFMEPVVYVKSIDTLFYETACWSWTTALWLAETIKSKSSIDNLSINQPSWKNIKISVDYDKENNIFKKATIKWKVDKTVSWDIDVNKNNYVIERCSNSDILELSFKSWLFELYKECFKNYPYFEFFEDEEINKYFQDYLNRGGIYFAKDNWKVIWFSGFVDLAWENEILQILTPYIQNNKWAINDCIYIADLWVKEDFRKNNIWRTLVLECLKDLPIWKILIMRTSEKNLPSWNLFKSLWFKEIEWINQETLSKRQDWQITTDKRIFSYYIKK